MKWISSDCRLLTVYIFSAPSRGPNTSSSAERRNARDRWYSSNLSCLDIVIVISVLHWSTSSPQLFQSYLTSMAKSKNHTAHNQSRKDHRNGLRKPSAKRHMNMKGESDSVPVKVVDLYHVQDATPSFWRTWSLRRNTTWTSIRLPRRQPRSRRLRAEQWWDVCLGVVILLSLNKYLSLRKSLIFW